MRALIDLGGEASAITEAAVQMLKIKRKKCSINVEHLDNTKSTSNAYSSFKMRSCVEPFETNVDAKVMNSLTKRLPSREIHYVDWPHIYGLNLADPNFNQSRHIDLILGADVYAEIINPDVKRGPVGTPVAQSTELGWILFGKTYKTNFETPVSINFMQVDEFSQKNFEIEEISNEQKISDAYYQLEKKFTTNAEFKKEYVKNINDYLAVGQMIEFWDTPFDRSNFTPNCSLAYDSFYLPHHAVINPNSTSPSGSMLLNNLLAILINWQIPWRNKPSERLRELGINRVSFGTQYSPSGSIHTIITVTEQNSEKFTESSKIIKEETYVDDSISGSHDVTSVLRIKQEMIQILHPTHLLLENWATNSEEVVATIPEDGREIEDSFALAHIQQLPLMSLFTIGTTPKSKTSLSILFCQQFHVSTIYLVSFHPL